jgi:flagellar motility protein MotE (MotC chaperone)
MTDLDELRRSISSMAERSAAAAIEGRDTDAALYLALAKQMMRQLGNILEAMEAKLNSQ